MILSFEVLSGGRFTIDTTDCPACRSQACLKVCAEQSPGPVLVRGDDGRPQLKPALAEVKRGVCTECLGCLLDCAIHGNTVVRFQVTLASLDTYLASEEAAGRVPVYRKKAMQA